MKELSCADVLMAQMAVADREEPPFPKEHLDAHIASCANCQHVLEQATEFNQLLASHSLSEPRVDLWPAIENRIAKRPGSSLTWKPFAIVGLLLVVYKLLETLPERDPGMVIKFVPLVILGLLFVLIRENPFRINTELMVER
jgi:predicted anti-sigma-YlaC factor YlaD